MRTWLPFAASVAGAALLAAGVLAFSATWLFLAVGALAALAGLVSLVGRGGIPLLIAGAWVLITSLVGWTAQWNALLGGLLVLATGFLAVAGGATRAGTGASA